MFDIVVNIKKLGTDGLGSRLVLQPQNHGNLQSLSKP